MNQGAFDEGKAAATLYSDQATNPYRREIRKIMQTGNRDAGGKLYELASDWDSGFVDGRRRRAIVLNFYDHKDAKLRDIDCATPEVALEEGYAFIARTNGYFIADGPAGHWTGRPSDLKNASATELAAKLLSEFKAKLGLAR